MNYFLLLQEYQPAGYFCPFSKISSGQSTSKFCPPWHSVSFHGLIVFSISVFDLVAASTSSHNCMFVVYPVPVKSYHLTLQILKKNPTIASYIKAITVDIHGVSLHLFAKPKQSISLQSLLLLHITNQVIEHPHPGTFTPKGTWHFSLPLW